MTKYPRALFILITVGAMLAAVVDRAHGQDQLRRIGSIDFYGYAGIDLDQVRSALPFHVGDPYSGPSQTLQEIDKAVRSVIDRPPTDVDPVCCDAQGNYMIYVGLPGTSIKPTPLNPVPTGTTKFPPQVIKLYDDTMDALTAGVLKAGGAEDHSKGYALSSIPEVRAKQLAVRDYAVRNEKLIRAVLDSSSEARQRIVASFMLGYAHQSRQQILDLVHATHDVDDTVRNNATRALGVLAESSPKVAAQIPAGGFIRMLSSGSWSDRNKGALVLKSLTRSRDAKLLAQLRAEALVPLIEMARWRNSGHAYDARIVLGRIAGIDEERLEKLVWADNPDEIINALKL